MNVLIVHNFYQQAGGEDGVFAEESRLLERAGHLVARHTVHNDSVEGMSKLKLARKTIWNRDSADEIRDTARQINADVVHFHNTFPLVSPAAYYGAHEAGAAVVQTLHNYRLLCPAATFYRDGGVCEDCLGKFVPWPGVAHKCYRDNRGASAVVAAMLTAHRAKGTWKRQVHAYIALTEFARAKFVEGGLPADRIVVKPNFVDPDPGLGDGAGDFILFVGRLTEEKGVSTMLDAWPGVFRASGAKLKIAGDGPLRADVERVAGDAGNGIEYLGRRPSSEVYGLMGSARALLFPSRWYEGQPRTIVESFAKGTPVLASQIGSITEMIAPERTGMLYRPGDAASLAETALRFAAISSAQASEMRAAARREFVGKYTAEPNLEALLDIYRGAKARVRC